MVAKRFFYICAGVLCLALAYHFGAQSATAQPGTGIACARIDEFYSRTSAVIGRMFYSQTGNNSPPVQYPLIPIPGTSPVVSCGINSSGEQAAVLANGEVWVCHAGQATEWSLLTTYPAGAPTPATRETWGGVKAKYRPEGAAKQTDK